MLILLKKIKNARSNFYLCLSSFYKWVGVFFSNSLWVLHTIYQSVLRASSCAITISENKCASFFKTHFVEIMSNTFKIFYNKPKSLFFRFFLIEVSDYSKLLHRFILLILATLSYSLLVVAVCLVVYALIFDSAKTILLFTYYAVVIIVFVQAHRVASTFKIPDYLNNSSLYSKGALNVCFIISIGGFLIALGLTQEIQTETYPISAKVFDIARPIFSNMLKTAAINQVSPKILSIDISGSVHFAAIKRMFVENPGVLHHQQLSSLITSQVIFGLMDFSNQKHNSVFSGAFLGYQDACREAHPTSHLPQLIDHFLVKKEGSHGIKAIIGSGKGHLSLSKHGFNFNKPTLLAALSKPNLLKGEELFVNSIKDIYNADLETKTQLLQNFLKLFPYSFDNIPITERVVFNAEKNAKLTVLSERLTEIYSAYLNELAKTQTMLVYASPDAINFEENTVKAALKITNNDYNLFIKTPELAKLK